jgi:hypothetical protein
MTTTYTNIPIQKTPSSSDQTVEIFNNYYKLPVRINNNELIAMTGFLESKGFEPVSAESTAITILTQSSVEGYSAMQVMDTLKGLSSVDISGVVAEILNFNRLKTSLLGVKQDFSPSYTVARNVIP